VVVAAAAADDEAFGTAVAENAAVIVHSENMTNEGKVNWLNRIE
jgi:hypothetical protein